MKRFTLTICVLIAALVAASAASAAPAARDPRVPALQHQVAVLTAGLNHEIDLNWCQEVWQGHINYDFINLFSLMIGGDAYADNTPSDNGSCARVGMNTPTPRRLASIRSPFASAFDAIVALNLTSR